MSWLYCHKCSTRYSAVEAEEPPPEGHFVKVVSGNLDTGPHSCERCERTIGHGEEACFVSIFTEHEASLAPEWDYFHPKDPVRVAFKGGVRPQVGMLVRSAWDVPAECQPVFPREFHAPPRAPGLMLEHTASSCALWAGFMGCMTAVLGLIMFCNRGALSGLEIVAFVSAATISGLVAVRWVAAWARANSACKLHG